MEDRTVSIGCAIAVALWALSLLMMAGSWMVADPQFGGRLGRTSLVACGAAVTATIRCYFVRYDQLMRTAFELGRARVTSLR